MEIKLAEAIIQACDKNGVKVELNKSYSPSWMRGKKTTGVVILDGDLGQLITAIVENSDLFVEKNLPKFKIGNQLRLSPFRISLILY